jgi:hypothetical protein
MAAPRVMVPVLSFAVLCLGLWASAGNATESPLSLGSSAPASDSMSFDVVYDSWINADLTTTNYGADKELWVGLYDPQTGKTYERRTLLWFDIAALPADAIVDSATLELTQTAASGETSYPIWPYLLTSDWSEYTVTWNDQPSWVSAGDPSTTLDADPGVKTWDVSGIVQNWRKGAKNNGILLVGDGKTVGTRVFGSRESESAPGRLTIYYHEPEPDTPTPTSTMTHTPTPTPTTTQTPTPTATSTSPQAFSDLGDAPDSSNSAGKQMEAYPGVVADFPTVYGTGSPPIGPLHRNQPLQYWLGAYISTEFEADSGYDEDAVNNLQPAAGLADLDLGDDGLDLPATWEHCKPVQLTFHVKSAISKASSAKLNIWVDWDGDGSWGDDVLCGQSAVSEWAVKNQPVAIPGYGSYTFTTPAFTVYRPDDAASFWLRVTLSDSDAGEGDGSGPAGGWADGETEDYLITGGQTITPTPTATATATPTITPPPFNFGVTATPGQVALYLDPLVTGSSDEVSASVQVAVSLVSGASQAVSLELQGAPQGLNYSFQPPSGTPPFNATLRMWVTRAQLPGHRDYNLQVTGTSGATVRTAPLIVYVRRYVYGDLSISALQAVQSVDTATANIPLIYDKATVFKATVVSTYNQTINAHFRLSLTDDQWRVVLIMPRPGAALAAPGVASRPAGPLPYPDTWGPVPVQPGTSVIVLPYIPPGREANTHNFTTDPAGIIRGRCFGPGYSACTVDTRYVPRPIGTTARVTVEVDPQNRIVESDEANNSASAIHPVIKTRPYKFLIVPYEYRGPDGTSPAPSSAEAYLSARDQLEYLLGTFPIADTKIGFWVLPYSFVWENRAGQTGFATDWQFFNRVLRFAADNGFDYGVAMASGCQGGWTYENRACIMGACRGEGSTGIAHEFNHWVGHMSDVYSLDMMVQWDEFYCQTADENVRTYCAYVNSPLPSGSRGRFCVEPDRWTDPTCPREATKTELISCHCSEGYERGGGSQPPRPCATTEPKWSVDNCRAACETACTGQVFRGPDGRTAHPASPGFWVNKYRLITNLMNYMMDASNGTGFPYVWHRIGFTTYHETGRIFHDGWSNMVRAVEFVYDRDPAVVVVSGQVNKNGPASFQPFARLAEAPVDLEPGATGEYRIRLADAEGKALFEAGFDPGFLRSDPYGGPTDQATFAYRVEWIAGTHTIELVKDNVVLASRTVSASAPVVTLTSPAGGAVFGHGQSIRVDWMAQDSDGDTLTYSLLVSQDDGESWLPIAIDLASPGYDLLTDRFDAGQSYRVKVVATDGVNIGEVVSGAFTMRTATYLPLLLRP